jgi:dTDP-4-dehydrorhamnose reductase
LLVTGGRTGYLGRHVAQTARGQGYDVLAVSSSDADLRDAAAVEALVADTRPDAVVHTAYVQSDWDVTATGSAHLAVAAARHGARLVLVSSDAVFSGADGLYDESAAPDPITSYGAAKAAAETTTLAVCQGSVVARASLILGDCASQHERLVHSLVGGAGGVLFADEQRCPVHVADLATALVELAGNDVRGVLHVGGAAAMSRFDLGHLIARRDGIDASRLRPGSRAALGVPGPIDVRLDSTRAASLLSTRLRGAREFL